MKPVAQRAPRPKHDPKFYADARALSLSMVRLHRELMVLRQQDYERVSGPVSPMKLFDLLLNDPFFAWLRPLSTATANLDELLATESDREPYRAFAASLRPMLDGDSGTEFGASLAAYAERPEIIQVLSAARRALGEFARGLH